MTRPWYIGLACKTCGRTVKQSEPATYHRPASGSPWAVHHECPDGAAQGGETPGNDADE